MPKERRLRNVAHEAPVKPHKRSFAVQDNAVERVEIGAATQASGTEILAALNASVAPQQVTTKKEKQALKRETFLHKLGSLKNPYSKSHTRREKRKAKEQLAGGGLNDIQAILSTIAADGNDGEAGSSREGGGEQRQDPESKEIDQQQQSKSGTQQRVGKIGEGKNMPLSSNQRRRALQMEQLRQPLVRSNPEFASNPFQTIRTHAQNTLVKHHAPTSS